MKKLSLFFGLFFFLLGCSVDSPTGIQIDADGFSVHAPVGWEYTSKTGIDSIVGEISGDDMTLTFDYGNNVGLFTQSSEFSASDYNITQETIDGVDAVIYTSKINGKGFTILDIKNPPLDKEANTFGNEDIVFEMYAENLSKDQEAIAVQIFRSIKF